MATKYVGKSIGARRLTWFPISYDPETGAYTYGTPQKLSRLIQIVRTPIMATGQLESDDGLEDNISLVMGYDITINASQLTDEIRAALLGHAIDEGSGLLINTNDVAPEGALAWEELISSKTPGAPKYKKWVLYRGSFAEFAETANSVVQNGIEYQTHNLTAKFIAREDTGDIGYTMREDSPDADTTKISAWFTAPQTMTEV